MNNFSDQPSKSVREAVYTHYGHDFQDAGEEFDIAAAAHWGRAYRWYLRGWLPKRSDAAIAELACGYGRLLYTFKSLGYTNLYGVDLSPDQVALARQIVPNVAQADVLDWLTKQPQAFDILIALDLIEHFYRDEALKFLDLCFAALKPGGRLVLQTPNADSPFGLQHRYNDITHEWGFNFNLLTRLLKRAGFSEIEAREQGPLPWGYSLTSTLRWLIWLLIRMALQIWNLAETGGRMPILTRVFLVSGVRGKR